MDAKAMAHHVATIQNLASQLTALQSNPEALESLLSKVESVARDAIYEIEDASSRVAKHIWKDKFKGCKEVRLSKFSNKYDSAYPFRTHRKFRTALQAGLIPGIRKDERWYVTVETLTEWYRLEIKWDEERRAVKRAA